MQTSMHTPGAGSALAIDAFDMIHDAGKALLAFRRHSEPPLAEVTCSCTLTPNAYDIVYCIHAPMR
jgi:hypothetical protein